MNNDTLYLVVNGERLPATLGEDGTYTVTFTRTSDSPVYLDSEQFCVNTVEYQQLMLNTGVEAKPYVDPVEPTKINGTGIYEAVENLYQPLEFLLRDKITQGLTAQQAMTAEGFERIFKLVDDNTKEINRQIEKMDVFNRILSKHGEDIDTMASVSQTSQSLIVEIKDNQAKQSSQITQISDLLASRISSTDAKSLIAQSANSIINKVEQKTDNGEYLVSMINQSPQGIEISGDKIHISGKTHIDDAIITDAMIKDISADTITAGQLNAGPDGVKINNLDINSLSGNKTNFIQSYWNTISDRLEITGNGLRTYNNANNVLLGDGKIILENAVSDINTGEIHTAGSVVDGRGHTLYVNGKPYGDFLWRTDKSDLKKKGVITLSARNGSRVALSYQGDNGKDNDPNNDGTTYYAISVDGDTGDVYFGPQPIHLQNTKIYLDHLDNYRYVNFSPIKIDNVEYTAILTESGGGIAISSHDILYNAGNGWQSVNGIRSLAQQR